MSEQDWEEWVHYWWNELLNRIIEIRLPQSHWL